MIQVGAEVNIDNSGLALHNCLSYSVYRLMCCPFRSVSIRPRLEVSFEDRLQNKLECSLDHAIADCRDDQRQLHLSPVRLWDGLKSVIRFIRCGASASQYSKKDASPVSTR